jgi:hypothetical protein
MERLFFTAHPTDVVWTWDSAPDTTLTRSVHRVEKNPAASQPNQLSFQWAALFDKMSLEGSELCVRGSMSARSSAATFNKHLIKDI